MGIYVKGMDMPYGCANCHFVSEPIYDAKGRARYVCNVPVEGVCGKGNTDEVIALYERASEAFPDWCPLVDVPTPHGKLVEFIDVATFEDEDSGTEEVNLGEAFAAYFKMREAKPVIEAEGE